MVAYIGECRSMAIKVLPPDVNQSDMFFTVVKAPGDEGRGHPLRPRRHQDRGGGRGGGGDRGAPLHRLRAPSTTSASAPTCGPEPPVVESFVKSGCFDGSTPAVRRSTPRSTGPWSAARRSSATARGASSLFGLLAGPEAAAEPARVPDAVAWAEAERLAFEKESLGFFITGHPLERFRDELAHWGSATSGAWPKWPTAPR
jgi:DNA polymerase-3 subunit alpha